MLLLVVYAIRITHRHLTTFAFQRELENDAMRVEMERQFANWERSSSSETDYSLTA